MVSRDHKQSLKAATRRAMDGGGPSFAHLRCPTPFPLSTCQAATISLRAHCLGTAGPHVPLSSCQSDVAAAGRCWTRWWWRSRSCRSAGSPPAWPASSAPYACSASSARCGNVVLGGLSIMPLVFCQCVKMFLGEGGVGRGGEDGETEMK